MCFCRATFLFSLSRLKHFLFFIPFSHIYISLLFKVWLIQQDGVSFRLMHIVMFLHRTVNKSNLNLLRRFVLLEPDHVGIFCTNIFFTNILHEYFSLIFCGSSFTNVFHGYFVLIFFFTVLLDYFDILQLLIVWFSICMRRKCLSQNACARSVCSRSVYDTSVYNMSTELGCMW